MITVSKVNKQISDKVILEDINIELEEGSCVLLKGHNGSGKTMLLRLLCGLIKPTQGQVTYDKDYRFGVVIENPSFLTHETAFYNLKYLASINKLIDVEEIDLYLKRLNLYDVKNKKVRTYSLGMKQRLAICQAFMENPDVILLDEPFNALDDENLGIVCDMIEEFKNKGKIIVVAAHGEYSNSYLFDKVIKMSAGKIVSVDECPQRKSKAC